MELFTQKRCDRILDGIRFTLWPSSAQQEVVGAADVP
jgi:hypothetical protein